MSEIAMNTGGPMKAPEVKTGGITDVPFFWTAMGKGDGDWIAAASSEKTFWLQHESRIRGMNPVAMAQWMRDKPEFRHVLSFTEQSMLDQILVRFEKSEAQQEEAFQRAFLRLTRSKQDEERIRQEAVEDKPLGWQLQYFKALMERLERERLLKQMDEFLAAPHSVAYQAMCSAIDSLRSSEVTFTLSEAGDLLRVPETSVDVSSRISYTFTGTRGERGSRLMTADQAVNLAALKGYAEFQDSAAYEAAWTRQQRQEALLQAVESREVPAETRSVLEQCTDNDKMALLTAFSAFAQSHGMPLSAIWKVSKHAVFESVRERFWEQQDASMSETLVAKGAEQSLNSEEVLKRFRANETLSFALSNANRSQMMGILKTPELALALAEISPQLLDLKKQDPSGFLSDFSKHVESAKRGDHLQRKALSFEDYHPEMFDQLLSIRTKKAQREAEASSIHSSSVVKDPSAKQEIIQESDELMPLSGEGLKGKLAQRQPVARVERSKDTSLNF